MTFLVGEGMRIYSDGRVEDDGIGCQSSYERGFIDGMTHGIALKEEEKIKVCLKPKPRWMTYKKWEYLINLLIYIKEVKND